MSDLILYTTDDGRSQIGLRTKDQTVWPSKRQMAELLDISTDNVCLHLKNIGTAARTIPMRASGISGRRKSAPTRRCATCLRWPATKTDQAARQFFASLQKVLLYDAAHGSRDRAGTGQSRRPAFRPAELEKNYLTEDEIDTLNRLVVIFLETAELRAKRQVVTRIAFWQENLARIITNNDFPLLHGAGTVSPAHWRHRWARSFWTTTGGARRRSADRRRT
jgi:hypothetical protein